MNSPSKPTLLHVLPSLEIGGTERQLLLLLPALNMFQHVVLCIQRWGPIGDELRKLNFPVHYIPCSPIWPLPQAQAIRNLINKVQPDLAMSYLPAADLFARVWLRHFGIHRIISSLRCTTKTPRYFAYLILERITSSRVDHYFANSQSIKTFFHHWLRISNDRITVLPNGINLQRFKNSSPNRFSFYHSVGLDPKKFFLTCVAKLRVEQKRQLDLLRALKLLLPDFPDFHLLLVGNGPDAQNVREKIHQLNLDTNVTMLGDRSDVPDLLHHTDLFVLPTLYEGMSNALMEAMAAGCAIITTNIPENRELVVDRESAVLVPPKNPPALARAILQCARDANARQALSRMAKQSIQSFDIETIALHTAEVIRKFLHPVSSTS